MNVQPTPQALLESVLEDSRDPGPDSGGDGRSGAWVFPANPKRFVLLQALRNGATETQSVNQHRQDIQPGDRNWFGVTGPDAGIYAVGRATSVPMGKPLTRLDPASQAERPVAPAA